MTYPLGLGNGSPVSTGYLSATAPMTIIGTASSPTSGAGTIIRQTDGEHAVVQVAANTSGVVAIRNLEIVGGHATGPGEVDGGGIFVGSASELALTTVLVTGNAAVGAAGISGFAPDGQLARGGGIYSAGALTLDNCVVGQNSAAGL